MTIEVLTVARASCPLDLLLFGRFRREVPGLVEATLTRNPGLAALGPILPIGTRVSVEIPAPAGRAAPREIVTLWTKAS
jgi:phage tail protein X